MRMPWLYSSEALVLILWHVVTYVIRSKHQTYTKSLYGRFHLAAEWMMENYSEKVNVEKVLHKLHNTYRSSLQSRGQKHSS